MIRQYTSNSEVFGQKSQNLYTEHQRRMQRIRASVDFSHSPSPVDYKIIKSKQFDADDRYGKLRIAIAESNDPEYVDEKVTNILNRISKVNMKHQTKQVHKNYLRQNRRWRMDSQWDDYLSRKNEDMVKKLSLISKEGARALRKNQNRMEELDLNSNKGRPRKSRLLWELEKSQEKTQEMPLEEIKGVEPVESPSISKLSTSKSVSSKSSPDRPSKRKNHMKSPYLCKLSPKPDCGASLTPFQQRLQKQEQEAISRHQRHSLNNSPISSSWNQMSPL